ncbi:transcriptional repressor CTCF-like [Cylas formicarius]|uniref:transcriptional repressor CTCF-like n=1 Tax=Cylas formicarius TaxID=197179 RepID=UPI002958A424|nr:transcriptional repressor CTCF-like [Cylas formicarius]
MDDRSSSLSEMKVCRFCLSADENDLTNICQKSSKEHNKQSVPLPVQIMACVAIEVFPNDGMPQLICGNCKRETARSYIFKTNCKRADDALRLFLYTGKLTKPNLEQVPHKDIAEPIAPREFKICREPASKETGQRVIKLEDGSEVVTLTVAGPTDTSCEPEENEIEKIIYVNDGSQELETQSDNDEDVNQAVQQVATECFACNHCDRTFPLKQLLELHVTNHERERHFNCSTCDKSFFSKYDLNKHERTHDDEKPYSCVVCGRSFAREALLRRHEAVHGTAPKYMCGVCDRTYLSKPDLDEHARKHQKRRPFTCAMCDKSFVFKQGLERHMATHAQDKPHKCNYCDASFNTAIRLARHVTSHAGLRPYPCKICARTFLLSHHLTRHMRTHYAAEQGRKPEETVGQHKCDICSMSFKRKDSLINHSAIHSMVNLVCVICNTSFETAQMVKEHITTHLQGLPFPCERCDYSFESSEQLEEHELKHAEMEYEEQIEQEFINETSRQMETDEEDADDDDDDGEVKEYTITDGGGLEAVPKNRPPKRMGFESDYHTSGQESIYEMEAGEVLYGRELEEEPPEEQKYIREFFKTEIESEVEEESRSQESPEAEQQEEVLRPIVRSEGTKVYKRKGPVDRKRPYPVMQEAAIAEATLETASLEEITDSSAEMRLSRELLNSIPKKSRTNVIVGDRVVKVQKFIMTKEEIKNLAKEGVIELKNGQVVLKNSGKSIINASLKPVQKKDIDHLIQQQQMPRVRLRQYQKKPTKSGGGGDDVDTLK